jgi:hypothetical protein
MSAIVRSRLVRVKVNNEQRYATDRGRPHTPGLGIDVRGAAILVPIEQDASCEGLGPLSPLEEVTIR